MTEECKTSEREVGELCARVESLADGVRRLETSHAQLDGYLRNHMAAEEARFADLNKSIVDIRLTMARWLGGGLALMIVSDWVMRAGLLG